MGGREGGSGGGGGADREDERTRRVPPTLSANHVAFLAGGLWGSTNSLELWRKNAKGIREIM